MVRRQRALNARQSVEIDHPQTPIPPTLAGESGRGANRVSHHDVDHPGALESMIPVWGSGKEALADFEVGNYGGAAFNAGMAVSDAFLAKAVASGLAKGGLKLAGPHVWRTKPWEAGQGARQWMGRQGFVKPGQPAHHWIFEQKSSVPEFIKNQPPFIKAMKDALQHGRIHGAYTSKGTRLPPFNLAQRLWFGTPQWAKAAYVSSAGHGGTAAGRAVAEKDSLSLPGR